MTPDAPILVHLKELRYRLMISMACLLMGAIIGFVFYETFIYFLFIPFKNIPILIQNQTLFMTTLVEGFTIRVKFAFLTGFVLSIPILLYQTMRFVFPGLKRKEKYLVVLGVFTGTLLAAFGFYICYYHLLPFSIGFLTSSEFVPKQVGVMLNFGSNIFYVFNLIFYTILIFQTPIVLELLLYLGFVRRKTLLSASRYVIISIFLLAAIVTPPDIITQIGLALPLVLLYFLTIFIAWIFKWGNDTNV